MDLKLDRLRDIYLTGVRPNGNDIGVGSYGKVFEVEYCGAVYAAKEVHSILIQGVGREGFEAITKTFLTDAYEVALWDIQTFSRF